MRNGIRATTAVVLCGVLIPNCKASEDYIDEADPHLVPTWICDGDPTPTYAEWDPQNESGKVKVYTHGDPNIVGGQDLSMILGRINRRKLCEASYSAGHCQFASPALTAADVPLLVRAYDGDGDRIDSWNVEYTILSSPKWTGTWVAEYLLLAKNSGFSVNISSPVFGTCPPCTEDPDAVPPITCDCPERGRVVDIDVEAVEVPAPPTASVVWPIDGSWFSSRVQTRRLKYKAGMGELEFAGPGLDAPVAMTVGLIRVGNSKNPGGVWTGTELVGGQTISRSGADDRRGDSTPSTTYGLKLELACQDP